jgi:GNAT superfamily N-acetyltransferase
MDINNFIKTHASSREERRRLEKEICLGIKRARQISINVAFLKVQQAASEMGWEFTQNFLSIKQSGRQFNVTLSPALKLTTQILDITLIPHGNGIELFKLEVNEDFQGRGYGGRFLDSLIFFLQSLGIFEIYVFPSPQGSNDPTHRLSNELPELLRFYSKRGFVKIDKSIFWKFNKDLFYLNGSNVLYDQFTLRKDLTNVA